MSETTAAEKLVNDCITEAKLTNIVGTGDAVNG